MKHRIEYGGTSRTRALTALRLWNLAALCAISRLVHDLGTMAIFAAPGLLLWGAGVAAVVGICWCYDERERCREFKKLRAEGMTAKEARRIVGPSLF